MTTVWTLRGHGVHGAPIIGIYSSAEAAEAAKEICELANDGWHELKVEAWELDRPYLSGFRSLVRWTLPRFGDVAFRGSEADRQAAWEHARQQTKQIQYDTWRKLKGRKEDPAQTH